MSAQGVDPDAGDIQLAIRHVMENYEAVFQEGGGMRTLNQVLNPSVVQNPEVVSLVKAGKRVCGQIGMESMRLRTHTSNGMSMDVFPIDRDLLRPMASFDFCILVIPCFIAGSPPSWNLETLLSSATGLYVTRFSTYVVNCQVEIKRKLAANMGIEETTRIRNTLYENFDRATTLSQVSSSMMRTTRTMYSSLTKITNKLPLKEAARVDTQHHFSGTTGVPVPVDAKLRPRWVDESDTSMDTSDLIAQHFDVNSAGMIMPNNGFDSAEILRVVCRAVDLLVTRHAHPDYCIVGLLHIDTQRSFVVCRYKKAAFFVSPNRAGEGHVDIMMRPHAKIGISMSNLVPYMSRVIAGFAQLDTSAVINMNEEKVGFEMYDNSRIIRDLEGLGAEIPPAKVDPKPLEAGQKWRKKMEEARAREMEDEARRERAAREAADAAARKKRAREAEKESAKKTQEDDAEEKKRAERRERDRLRREKKRQEAEDAKKKEDADKAATAVSREINEIDAPVNSDAHMAAPVPPATSTKPKPKAKPAAKAKAKPKAKPVEAADKKRKTDAPEAPVHVKKAKPAAAVDKVTSEIDTLFSE